MSTSIAFDTAGAGISSTRSNGGGALFSLPMFSSNHLSISSALLANGRFPNKSTMSSLQEDGIGDTVGIKTGGSLPGDDLLIEKQLGNLLHVIPMLRQEVLRS